MADYTVKISTPADLTGAQATKAAFDAVGAAVEKVATEEQAAGRSADELKGKFDQMRDAGGRFASVGEGVAGAGKSMKELHGETEGFLEALELGFGINFSEKIIEGVQEIGHAFVETMAKGIEFNAEMEKSGIALAGALRASDPERFLNFDQAKAVGVQALDQLRGKANELGLDLHGLAESFSINLNAMTEGGVRNLQDQINLTVLLGQVAQAKGISGFQATRDTTDLLSGMASRTMLGRELGIKDEDIKKAKEAGTVMEFLTEKLKAYGEAGAHASDTFSASMQTIKNELEQLSGEVAKPTFDRISEFLREIKKPLGAEETSGVARGTGDAIDVLAENAVKAGPLVLDVTKQVLNLGAAYDAVRGIFKPIFDSSALGAQVDAQDKIVFNLRDQITAAKSQEQVTAARTALEAALAAAVQRTTAATGDGKVAAENYLKVLEHLKEVFPIGTAKDAKISPEGQAKEDAATAKDVTGTTDFALLKANANGDDAEIDRLTRKQAIEAQIDALKKEHPKASAKELEVLAEQNVALKEQADALKTINREQSQVDKRSHKDDTLEGVTSQISEKSKRLSSALPDDLRGSLSVSQMASAIESLPASTAAEATEKAKLLKIVGELVELEERRAKLSGQRTKQQQDDAKDQADTLKKHDETLQSQNEGIAILQAKANGQDALAKKLEEERKIRQEIDRLMKAGLSYDEAKSSATKEAQLQDQISSNKGNSGSGDFYARQPGESGNDFFKRTGRIDGTPTDTDPGGGLHSGGLKTGNLDDDKKAPSVDFPAVQNVAGTVNVGNFPADGRNGGAAPDRSGSGLSLVDQSGRKFGDPSADLANPTAHGFADPADKLNNPGKYGISDPGAAFGDPTFSRDIADLFSNDDSYPATAAQGIGLAVPPPQSQPPSQGGAQSGGDGGSASALNTLTQAANAAASALNSIKAPSGSGGSGSGSSGNSSSSGGYDPTFDQDINGLVNAQANYL